MVDEAPAWMWLTSRDGTKNEHAKLYYQLSLRRSRFMRGALTRDRLRTHNPGPEEPAFSEMKIHEATVSSAILRSVGAPSIYSPRSNLRSQQLDSRTRPSSETAGRTMGTAASVEDGCSPSEGVRDHEIILVDGPYPVDATALHRGGITCGFVEPTRRPGGAAGELS